MIDRITALWPEIVLFITVIIVMLMGTSGDKDLRRATTWVAGLGLLIAFVLAADSGPVDTLMPALAGYVRPMVCAVGLLLLMGFGALDRPLEEEVDKGRRFDPLDATQGEFLCFFLLSLIGVMLITTANDLIWLFLALELTSLPIYVMVAIGRPRLVAQEAGVKYFFLGALAVAIFLYGFALLYGATGTLHLSEMRSVLEDQAADGGLSGLALLGLILATVGISFKVAAVPMHWYVPDVYQGAATSVAAFLAFVPKTAGFIALMMLLATVVGLGEGGQVWPEAVRIVLWVLAALTMTVGNTLAILQSNVKRMLAYSSIGHSGFMLVGIVAGSGLARGDFSPSSDGFAAVLFYLLAYGVTNMGAFLVLACLERRGEDLESFDDLQGLRVRYPGMATILAICSLSLLGLPPLIGFFAKVFIFTSGIAAGEYVLVVLVGLNSAVGAWYYLRIAGTPWLTAPGREAEEIAPQPVTGRRIAAGISAASAIGLIFLVSPLINAGFEAAEPRRIHASGKFEVETAAGPDSFDERP